MIALLILVSSACSGPKVPREVFGPQGEISRVEISAPAMTKDDSRKDAPVHAVQETGAPSKRVNLVFVGDGYREEDLAEYVAQVDKLWAGLLEIEPFRAYATAFNVYRVDVVSEDRGVDMDPPPGEVDSALGMSYHCGGIARLLCVDEGKARAYAKNAPRVDQIVAVANSATYGGAGGEVATVAGGNINTVQILAHELGHTFGGLADEYSYSDIAYSGDEPTKRNLSTHPSEAMLSRGVKWHLWLGLESPDGGVVDTFEGASLGTGGVYRPTENSLMRSLGREFNLPGLEALVIALYRRIRPVDEATSESSQLARQDRVQIKTRDDALELEWYVDGNRRESWSGMREVRLADLPGELQGKHRIRAVARDRTPWVRDAAAIEDLLTESREWEAKL